MNALLDPRERLLSAALGLFARHGFGSTSTRAVARAAGLPESAVFKHYRGKEHLFEEVLDAAWADLAVFRVPPELHADVRIETSLGTLWANWLACAMTHPQPLALLANETLFRPERFRQQAERYRRHRYPLFARSVARAISDGQLRASPPLSLLRLITFVGIGYCISRTLLMPQGDWNDADELGWMAGVIADGLRCGAASRGK